MNVPSVEATASTASTVEREVELDATVEEVWAALCEPDTWLADEGTLDVSVGGTGQLVEDGVVRRAVVETVEVGRRLVYRWWNDGDDGDDGDGASRVELTIVPSDGPTRLVVRETTVAAPTPAELRVTAGPTNHTGTTAGLRWDVRFVCLAMRQDALVCQSRLIRV